MNYVSRNCLLVRVRYLQNSVGPAGTGPKVCPSLGTNFIHFLCKVLGQRSVQKEPFRLWSMYPMSQSLWATPEVVMSHPRNRYDPPQKSLWAIPEVVIGNYKSCYGQSKKLLWAMCSMSQSLWAISYTIASSYEPLLTVITIICISKITQKLSMFLVLTIKQIIYKYIYIYIYMYIYKYIYI